MNIFFLILLSLYLLFGIYICYLDKWYVDFRLRILPIIFTITFAGTIVPLLIIGDYLEKE